LYGGAHYSQSCSADLTPQGRAIQQASARFGDGETLPFTPCKKGFIPVVETSKDLSYEDAQKKEYKLMYACFHHDAKRRKRVQRDNGYFRKGEVDLAQVFWSRYKAETDTNK